MVLRRIDCNPVQPGIERAIPTKPSDSPICFNKNLLRDIFNVTGIIDISSNQIGHLVLILSNQQIERRIVTGLHPLYDGEIDAWLIHPHPDKKDRRTAVRR